MVVILIGIALSGISVVAASTFFTQQKQRSVSLMGDSEALTHYSMLLRQSWDDKKCLDLDDVKPTFLKVLPGGKPKEFPGIIQQKGKDRVGRVAQGETLKYMRNSLSKNYELDQFTIVQRSNVIGEDPGRVIADLRVTILDKVSKKKSSFTVPMLLDLDPSHKSIACMQKANAEEMCTKNLGKFDEKAAGQICAL